MNYSNFIPNINQFQNLKHKNIILESKDFFPID